VQSPKKVKHERQTAHLVAVAGIGLVLVVCVAFVGAFAIHLVGRPLGWSILAIIGGMSALGLAGLSFIADLAETHAKRLHHKEEH
jgi:hypothetical protein